MNDEWQAERIWYNDRTFEAVISKEEIDKQKDLIKIAGLEAVMDWFVKYGVIHYKHSFINFGEPLAWKRDGDQIVIKVGAHSNYKNVYPVYDWIWKQIKEYYQANVPGYMSIGGQKLEPQLKCDAFTGACYNEISKLGIFEASWVGASPANKGAAVTHVNMMAKSESDAEKDSSIVDALFDLLEKQELIQKPFGPWKDWDACMDEMRQQYDEETAKKVCGKLKARLEKRAACSDTEKKEVVSKETELKEAMEESEEGKIEKQEGEGEPEAPPAEENPMAMVMERIEAMEARLSALEEMVKAPAAMEGEPEAKAEPAGKPGEVKVSFKSELDALKTEIPTLVKTAITETLEAHKIVTKSVIKPNLAEGGGKDSGSALVKAREEAEKATSAKEFFK